MSQRAPLKIGISFSLYGHTYGRYGEEKYVKLKEQGYDAVDYNFANTDTAVYAMDAHALRAAMEAERCAAAMAGVAISQIHGPWRWPPRDGTAEERAERMEKMKRAVDIAALLGCEHVVVHPIMPYGEEDLKVDKAQETWEQNVAFFTALADYAASHAVTVCVENMPMRHFSLATPQRLLEFVKAVNHDGLKICLDTGHVAVFPDLAVGDEVRRLGGYIRVLHIHDNGGESDAHAYPSEGIIDWADFFTALEEVGYDGVLSLETAPSGGYDDEAFAQESVRLNRLLRTLAVRRDEDV